MPISEAGNSPRFLVRTAGAGGFTLIELMIVITIIGLASAAAVLAIPDPRGRLADEADRFAAKARTAHDSAIVEARPVSVWVSPGGYGFDEREAGGWSPISEKPLKVEAWKAGTRARTASERERIIFDSTGLADRPIDVTLVRSDETTTVHVAADGTVRVGA